ncbi:MAG: hypothetical protein AB8B78_05240 [Polaribacter sp.]
MLHNKYFSSEITCSFVGCFGDYTLSAYGLFIFSLGSFVVISILLFFYSKIPSSSISLSKLDNSIYQSKDILLQSSINDDNLLVTESTNSNFVKSFVYIIILILIFTPVYKLLGTGYFL